MKFVHAPRVTALLWAAACAAVALVACIAPSAAQAADAPLSISECQSGQYPTIRCAFTMDSEESTLPSFDITEDGEAINDYNVFAGKIGQTEDNPVNVVYMLIDASLTMRGAKLPAAQEAARRLLDEMSGDDQVGLMSFGAETNLLVEPTEDTEAISAAIDTIQLSRGTVMYNAIDEVSGEFPHDATRRVVVLLSDGKEFESSVSLDEAIAAAREAEVEIYTVGIRAPSGYDPAPLERMANETGGEFHEVTNVSQLNTLYSQLGQELLRSYWFEYETSLVSGRTVELEMAAEGYENARFEMATPLIETAGGGPLRVPSPAEVPPAKPIVPIPDSRLGMLIAALPFGALMLLLVYLWLRKLSGTNLTRRVAPYTIEARNTAQAAEKQGPVSAFAPMFKLTERVLGKSSMFRRMRVALEQANLPLREVELLYLRVVFALIGGPLAFLFTGGWKRGLGALVLGFMLPYWWVKLKARKRKKRFEDQLPDMLSSVSASLQAGHSFNQAINAVIKEAPDPMAEELNRCLTEARLGLPIEDALEAMAVRLDSNDFEFAVTTVNIQRQVGGSLAEILEMVADTVRNRQQFKKKVKALTSMGRASAYVLLGVPFFIGGALTLMNPEYMNPLWFSDTGHKLLMGTAFLMFLGWAACQKIVSFKI